MPDSRRQVQPAALKWQDDGELAAQDVFNLVCRLRAVESGETSNELWRLAQKYPNRSSRSAQPGPDSLSPEARPRQD